LLGPCALALALGQKGNRGTFARSPCALVPLCPFARCAKARAMRKSKGDAQLLPRPKRPSQKQPLLLAMQRNFCPQRQSKGGKRGTFARSPFALLPFCPMRKSKGDAQKQPLLLAMQRKGKRGDAQKQGLQRQEARAMRKSKGCNFCLGRIGLLSCSPGYCWLC